MVSVQLAAFPAPAYLRESTLDGEQTKQRRCDAPPLMFQPLIDLHVAKQSLCSARVLFEVVSRVVCGALPSPHRSICAH